MKKLSALFFITAAVSLLGGCTNLSHLSRLETRIPITTYVGKDRVDDAGAIYLWPPYASAAIVDKQGNRCVLTASGAKTFEAESEAALKVGKALDKIEGLDANTKGKIVESLTKISAPDNRSTFVDVALFHLCMLDQNGTFKFKHKKDDEDEGKVVLKKVDIKDETPEEKKSREDKSRILLESYMRVIEIAKDLK